MDDLVQWLTAQLDADERIARAACEGGEGRWHPLGDQHGGSVAGDHDGYHVALDEGYPTLEQATHIAEHDPARVLREVEMKRSLVAAYASALTVGPDVEGGYKRPIREALARQARDFLLVLALPFADRPGFAEAIASAE